MKRVDSTSSLRVALYGGAFSPPHLGHASIIEAVLRLFPCDEIWVMPSANRHDKIISASEKHRLDMLKIMIDELYKNPKVPIIISDFELKINKPTATYETLKMLSEEYPNHEFYFVLGSENLDIDKIESSWVEGKKLFKETSFIAIKNPNSPLPDKLPPHLTILENVAWTTISSTFLRNLLEKGYSGIPYLTKGVADYIKENRLYEN